MFARCPKSGARRAAYDTGQAEFDDAVAEICVISVSGIVQHRLFLHAGRNGCAKVVQRDFASTNGRLARAHFAQSKPICRHLALEEGEFHTAFVETFPGVFIGEFAFRSRTRSLIFGQDLIPFRRKWRDDFREKPD